MPPRRPLACACLLLLLGCASSPKPVPEAALTAARLYPLAAGSAWSYDVDTGDGATVLATMRVTEAAGGRAAVQGGEGITRYEQRPDGLYRMDRDGYLLKEPVRAGATWPSGGGMTAEISTVAAALETPAGRFTGCVEVVERGAPTGAVISTTYCPDVGPVQVISSLDLTTGAVRVVARLRGYQIGDGANAIQATDSPSAQ
jgi:hypothetical protein